MRGSLRQRAGAWELKVYVGRDPLTGRKRYASKTVRGVSRRAAEKELAAFVTEVGDSPAFVDRHRTFGELLERWYEAASPDRSPNTRSSFSMRKPGLAGASSRRSGGWLSLTPSPDRVDIARLRVCPSKRGAPVGGTERRECRTGTSVPEPAGLQE